MDSPKNSSGINKINPAWIALIVILAVMLCYLPAILGEYIWDDADYVTKNMMLRSLTGLRRIWFELRATPQYYPLVFSSFWIEYHLWGLNPLGYHVVNVLLHAGSALLLMAAMRRLGLRGALLGGFIFALHPVCVESVAWITERKNVLSTFCYLLSFLALIRFYGLEQSRDDGGEEAGRAPGSFAWGAWVLALVFFICALLAKTVACTLPVAILIVVWWKRGRLRLPEILAMAPFLAIGAALGWVTAWMEKTYVGASGTEWSLSPLERGLVAGRIVWFYLAKLLWPAHLTFIYPRWTVSSAIWWQYLFPLGLLALLIVLWLARRRIGRGPLAALLIFILTLFPALGFINVYPMRYSFVADHFQYLAMLAPIVLTAALAGAGLHLLTPERRRIAVIGCVLLLAVLGALTWRQGRIYKDRTTLWRANIAENPNSWMAMTNLGGELIQQGHPKEACDIVSQSLRLNPKNSPAYLTLAITLETLGRNTEAEARYVQALNLDPYDASAHFYFGNFNLKLHHYGAASAEYQRTLALNPSDDEACRRLAASLAAQGEYAQALVAYSTALQLEPHDTLTWVDRAILLDRLGRTGEAIACLLQGLSDVPDKARLHFELAPLLIRQKRVPEALEHLQEALRLPSQMIASLLQGLPKDPDSARLHFEVAPLLIQQKRAPEAVDHLHQALRLAPGNPIMANRLAWLLATAPDPHLRNGAEALTLAQQACKGEGANNSGLLDTLAAALAEAGRFEEAAQTARRAADLARAAKDEALARDIETHLARYQSRQPWHENN